MITGDKSNKVNEPNLYQHNQQLQAITRKQDLQENSKQERQDP